MGPAPVTSASEGRPQSAGVIGTDPTTCTLHEGAAGTTMLCGAGAPDAWSLCGRLRTGMATLLTGSRRVQAAPVSSTGAATQRSENSIRSSVKRNRTAPPAPRRAPDRPRPRLDQAPQCGPRAHEPDPRAPVSAPRPQAGAVTASAESREACVQAAGIRLKVLIGRGVERLLYVYDFDDGWCGDRECRIARGTCTSRWHPPQGAHRARCRAPPLRLRLRRRPRTTSSSSRSAMAPAVDRPLPWVAT